MRARQGQPITLTCGVETSKELDVSFQWEKNGILIKPYERIKITTHGKTSVLHISKAKQGDTGMYICRASGTSETGSSDQRAAYVRVQGKIKFIQATTVFNLGFW